MSERYRNDLYYIEHLSSDVAIYPDGTVGQIEEKKVESIKTVRGRRPDRVRKVKYKQEKLVQTALYASASEYRIADKGRLKKAAKKYNADGADPSWSLDDMPDRVIKKFTEWRDALTTPSPDEIMIAAAGLIVDNDELQNATLECTWCNGGENSQYACRGCGYAGAYYKYPVIRLLDDKGHYDMPFSVAQFVQSNPSALFYDTRTMFNHEGKMAAEQVAVLRVQNMDGVFAGRDHGHVMRVDPADQLYGEITIPLSHWKEDPRWPYTNPKVIESSSPRAVIEALQKKCALEIVREQTDTADYQELYDQLVHKLRVLGKGAMTAVIRGRYEGMGEHGYELSFGNLPFDNSPSTTVASSGEVRMLIKKAVPMIDAEKGIIDSRWEGGY